MSRCGLFGWFTTIFPRLGFIILLQFAANHDYEERCNETEHQEETNDTKSNGIALAQPVQEFSYGSTTHETPHFTLIECSHSNKRSM